MTGDTELADSDSLVPVELGLDEDAIPAVEVDVVLVLDVALALVLDLAATEMLVVAL